MKRTVTIAAAALSIILAGCVGSPVARDDSKLAVDGPSSASSPTEATAALSASAASASERPTFPHGAISTDQAVKSLGKVKTVCGEVVTATYAKSSTGSPTFLNLDKARGRFTIVI